MILTKDAIKNRIDSCNMIENCIEDAIGNVSVDLRVESIVGTEDALSEYELNPGETVFVKTMETLNMPLDLVGIIGEKNSRMRQGLVVSGPRYQPGHKTSIYLRVQNISTVVIRIAKGNQIAQIFFETLDRETRPYEGTFQGETKYKGLGNYQQQYEDNMFQKISKEKEDIDKLTDHIYANVLTLMGIIAAIFTIISINYSAFTNTELSIKYIATMNVTLGLCITLLFGLMLLVINNKHSKVFKRCYLVIFICLAVASIAILLL